MCQGATQSYAGILACRFFLGIAEAGFYCGGMYRQCMNRIRNVLMSLLSRSPLSYQLLVPD
jgi:hypothetical protein